MYNLSVISDIKDLINENLELSGQIGGLSAAGTLAALGTAVVCGLVIYLIYRFFYRGIVYSENFNLLLVLVTVVTAFVINTISANIVLSLGMVGALSIVRFRSAIKDPLDIGFLFFGIGAGVTAGAGLYFTAFIGTASVSVVFILLTFLKKEKKSYLLIVRYGAAFEDGVNSLLASVKYKLKNKIHTADYTELTIEIKIKRNDADAAAKFKAVEGVEMVTLLEYSGDYMN